jgi:hypothetical protein
MVEVTCEQIEGTEILSTNKGKYPYKRFSRFGIYLVSEYTG